jgi:hypothetical protein
MTPEQTIKKIAAMDSLERFSKAQEKIQWMVDELIVLIELHENNDLITYSPLLSDQIPRSYAARAFNVVQESIHRYEIIRLCTFWDGVDFEKANIPTVIVLVGDRSVSGQAAKQMEDHFGNMGFSIANPHPDPAFQAQIEALLHEDQRAFGREEGAKAMRRLEDTIKSAHETAASPRLTSVRNLRDKLAHRLKKTHAENGPSTVNPAKYGDEKVLLQETINIVDGLHLSINGTNRDWEEVRRIARKNARALWEHCSFDIQD